MNDILRRAFDPETFREQGHVLIDLLADYLQNTSSRTEEKAIFWNSPEENLAFWNEEARRSPTGNPTALFSNLIERSTRLHHPRTMGHQVAAPAPLAALTGALTGLLNNGMALYEMGLSGSPLEKIVVDRLARRIDWPEGGGILTSGGTLANLTALLTARALRAPGDVWSEGHGERLAVMVSEEAHYCIDRAARIMGLGTEGILKIPCNERFKIRSELLESALKKAEASGLKVFAVVGSACSTATGAHDDLNALADFAEKHGLWFHVDGAHGGGAIFSRKYKALLAGLERADSVVIDFHKMLLTPGLATAVVYRKTSDSYRTFQQKAQYLWSNQTAEEWYNYGKRTFECTKLMMSAKVFALMQTYGDELFEANVDTLYDLAKSLYKRLAADGHFECAHEPECNILCFRYRTAPGEDVNEFNRQIRGAMLEEGRFYIVHTQIRGEYWLRVALMNPMTEEQDLEYLIGNIHRVADSITIK